MNITIFYKLKEIKWIIKYFREVYKYNPVIILWSRVSSALYIVHVISDKCVTCTI